MKDTRYYCDRCGIEIRPEEDSQVATLKIILGPMDKTTVNQWERSYHLCRLCNTQVLDRISEMGAESPL